jgi:hypothetical protein
MTKPSYKWKKLDKVDQIMHKANCSYFFKGRQQSIVGNVWALRSDTREFKSTWFLTSYVALDKFCNLPEPHSPVF